MKPNFFVFCEGESEVAYISHLRSQYRCLLYTSPTRNNLVLVTERMREPPFDNDERQPINKRLKDILP